MFTLSMQNTFIIVSRTIQVCIETVLLIDVEGVYDMPWCNVSSSGNYAFYVNVLTLIAPMDKQIHILISFYNTSITNQSIHLIMP